MVIGSENSSNTVALDKVAGAFGCPRVVRVNDASELPDDLSGTVGVTAGASAPDALVLAVVARLAPSHGVESATVTVEEEYFPPPPELRDLLRGLEVAPVSAQRGTGSTRRPVPATTDHCRRRPEGIVQPPEQSEAGSGRGIASGGTRGRPWRSWRETVTMTNSFTSMDTSTAEQWGVIGTATRANQGRVADRVLAMLESLVDVVDGFAVDQLTHCLQTATRAERRRGGRRDGRGVPCHDIGKAVSVPNHPRIAAEILRPYVRPEVTEAILYHQDFQGRHYYHHFDMDPSLRAIPGHALVRPRRALRRRMGPDELRPRLPHGAPVPLRTPVREVFGRPHF